MSGAKHEMTRDRTLAQETIEVQALVHAEGEPRLRFGGIGVRSGVGAGLAEDGEQRCEQTRANENGSRPHVCYSCKEGVPAP
jgi:hypothetical protein